VEQVSRLTRLNRSLLALFNALAEDLFTSVVLADFGPVRLNLLLELAFSLGQPSHASLQRTNLSLMHLNAPMELAQMFVSPFHLTVGHVGPLHLSFGLRLQPAGVLFEQIAAARRLAQSMLNELQNHG
jgi:hypothetical protein